MPWQHALRDLAILALTLLVWRTDAAVRGAGGVAAALSGVSAGFLAALCGYLVHEWGHWLGARMSHSVVHLPERLSSVFLFRFDADRNDRRQFLSMSCGGFAASACVVAAFVLWLPRDTFAGLVALALTAAGVLATAVLELPPAWRVHRGAPLPRGIAYVSGSGRGEDAA